MSAASFCDAEVLTPGAMAAAEQLAISHGLTAQQLMENAGKAVAAEIARRWTSRPVVVLCGPGNNGGDGFVVARLLREAGWPVRVALAGEAASLPAQAASMAALWGTEIATPAADLFQQVRLVVDALFGTGLSRPLGHDLASLVRALSASGLPVIAVDIPSGVDGATGRILGTAVTATLSVTFCRKKPGHLLLPGRECCGEIIVADIGITGEEVRAVKPKIYENLPSLWFLPRRSLTGHKYDAGHAVAVSGGPSSTGAARLAAQGAQRIGAGLVTVASPTAALSVNAAHLTSIMLAEVDGALALAGFLEDRRRNVVVLGPAMGVSSETRGKVRAALASEAAVVLDADALTAFQSAPHELFAAIAELPNRPVILTPHAGEFARLFGVIEAMPESRVEKARRAAALSRAIVVLKGADSIIASPDGRAIINANAPPWLATAGAGDVLAGMIAGLLAQAMPPLQAAAAAVFAHGEVAKTLGPGLIAEDLVTGIPAIVSRLHIGQNSIGANQTPLL